MMFRSRYDHISELIDLYQRLDPTNINSLLENSNSINKDIQNIRQMLKTEIESFAINIINGLIELHGTMDIKFVEKVNEFNPNFVGETLANVISKYYLEIGFNGFLKMIVNIKNNISIIYAIEALFNEIIIDGEKHRDEACELTKKLQEITFSKDFNSLSIELRLKVENMIKRMKPYARPINRKSFLHSGRNIPLKRGKEYYRSYPIISKTGDWIGHNINMNRAIDEFNHKTKRIKKLLKK